MPKKNSPPSDELISYDDTGINTYDIKSHIPVVPEFFKINDCIYYKREIFIIQKTINDLLTIKLESIKNNCSDKTKIIMEFINFS